MPVLNCPCGAEVRVSPGRMLAMGNEPFVCPDCGQSLVDDHARLIEQPELEFSAADEADDDAMEFAELPSGDAIDAEASTWFDVEFAALEKTDEPEPDGRAEDGHADGDIRSEADIRVDADIRDDQVQQVVIPPPQPVRGSFVPIPPMKPINFPRL